MKSGHSGTIVAKARLGSRANKVKWVVADVTTWEPQQVYDLWHDRAAFHFLTEEHDRMAYVARLSKAVKPDGHAIIATFAPEVLSGVAVFLLHATMQKASVGCSGTPSS